MTNGIRPMLFSEKRETKQKTTCIQSKQNKKITFALPEDRGKQARGQ